MSTIKTILNVYNVNVDNKMLLNIPGILLGCVSATYDIWEVLTAVGVTIVATVALTIFAFQVRISSILYLFCLVLLHSISLIIKKKININY